MLVTSTPRMTEPLTTWPGGPKAADVLTTRHRPSPLTAFTVTGAETGEPSVLSQLEVCELLRLGVWSQLSDRLIWGPGTGCSCPARNPGYSATTCCSCPCSGSQRMLRPP